MNVPKDLKYAKTDEWVKVEENIATVGVSDYAQSQLSDVVYVEITVAVGDQITANTTIATIESVKAAADVNASVSGVVVEINENLPQTPENVNDDPFGEAWLVKIKMDNPDELQNLLDAGEYQSFCEERDQ
jgi:glycine cleavage system H protein